MANCFDPIYQAEKLLGGLRLSSVHSFSHCLYNSFKNFNLIEQINNI